jgi:pullulanase/glycogen debranching enzyme
MKTLITGDKSQVYGYDPETKSEVKTMACQVQSKVKVILTVVFNHKGIVHHEYIPNGQTDNKEYYVKVLCQLPNAVRQK